jgi:hypothetical protein
VFGFTLDQNVGEFVLSHDNIKIPDSGKIYSFNEGNYAMWTPGLKKYMDSLKARSGRVAAALLAAASAQALTRCRAPLAGWRQEGGRQGVQRALHRLAGGRLPPHHAVRRHLRCVGEATLCSFVRLVRQSTHPLPSLCSPGYPGDTKNPNGKLRLLYECAPMSFLAEQAGGKGTDGKGRVLDIQPDKVHQRVPLFIGSKNEVDYLMECLK